jgi:hypothetical protein
MDADKGCSPPNTAGIAEKKKMKKKKKKKKIMYSMM